VFDLVPFVKMVASSEDENKGVKVAIKGILCGKLLAGYLFIVMI
jgi:hypothetical protein